MEGACAQLKTLDLLDITIPLNEVKSHLVARYQDRHHVHPRQFEDVVASVFKSFGFHAITTAYQNDGGIDVILLDGDARIGVQVKRSKNKIDVEQIRALAGALYLDGYTEGVFVTTSTFTNNAIITADRYAARGIPIRLVNADGFLDALQITEKRDIHQGNLMDLVYEIQDMGENTMIYDKEGPY